MHLKQTFERWRDISAPAIVTNGLIGLSTGIVPATDGLREQAGIIGDYYNVAGNMLWSGPIAVVAVGAAALCERKDKPLSTWKRIGLGLSFGAALGLGANAISETDPGFEHVGRPVLEAIGSLGLTELTPEEVANKYSNTNMPDLLAGTGLAIALAGVTAKRRDTILKHAKDKRQASQEL